MCTLNNSNKEACLNRLQLSNQQIYILYTIHVIVYIIVYDYLFIHLI